MAGDWIKMRIDLATCPKVVRISSALRADRLRTVGGLHAVWCLFDVHSHDGKLAGYTPESLDELIGFPGFAEAMIDVGWLEWDGEFLVTPRFDEHNGYSAKRRATDAKRRQLVRSLSAVRTQKVVSRGEKRREEIKTPKPPCAFDRFWDAYPRKEDKKRARSAWEKANPDESTVERIVADVTRRAGGHDWRKEGGKYIPLPATYLNGRRWEDEGVKVPPPGPSQDSHTAALREATRLHMEELRRSEGGQAADDAPF